MFATIAELVQAEWVAWWVVRVSDIGRPWLPVQFKRLETGQCQQYGFLEDRLGQYLEFGIVPHAVDPNVERVPSNIPKQIEHAVINEQPIQNDENTVAKN